MNTFTTKISIIIALLLLQSKSYAQEDQFNKSSKAIEKEVLTRLSNGDGPGISVSVQLHGKSYNGAYGVTRVDSGLDVDSNHYFMGASTSKVLVAAAILKLQALGKLNINQSVNAYIPNVDPGIGKITINQLLTHTGGLKDKTNDFGPRGVSRQISYSKNLTSREIFADPGAVFSYSNIGYNILGGIIEAVEGTDFNSAMQYLIFDPLNMNHSTYRQDELNHDQIAFGHNGSLNNFRTQLRMPDNAEERASGMLLTTAGDMTRFLHWLIQSEFDDYRIKLLEVFSDKQATGSYWGYGYGLFHSNYCNVETIWHTGGIPGYSATFIIVPSRSFSMVVMTNGSTFNRWSLIQMALENYLGLNCKPTDASTEPIFTNFNQNEMAELIGTYTQGIGAKIELKVENNDLILRDGHQEFQVRKNQKGKLVTFIDGKPNRSYTIRRGEDSDIMFLQYWVRAYPKIE